MPKTPSMDQLTSFAKRRGFVFAGSEIYGGLANTWDYGPLGVELKNNIKQAWWQTFVRRRADIVGLDSAILTNSAVWGASGHLDNFTDPLVDCRSCKHRHRADHLIENYLRKKRTPDSEVGIAAMSEGDLHAKLTEHTIACPHCGQCDYTPVRRFNLMFRTFQGVLEDASSTVYLRPETAQGIFINFKNIQTTTRKKLPFGVGQIGKSFRNEITPGNFIFRTREFEQMELEFFCRPEEAHTWYEHWRKTTFNWLLTIGLKQNSLRWREHYDKELSHYSQATADIEFAFPFGWGELWGIAHRGNFDLTQHQHASGKDLYYVEAQKGEKFLPHVIEPALGVERLVLALLVDAYSEDAMGGETRTVLRLHPRIAPVKFAVLPLSKKLAEPARKLYADLLNAFACDYDGTGSIGRRYRRFDEIGAPFCLTFDFESLEDASVTIRNRDDGSQERVKMTALVSHLQGLIQA